MPTVIQADQDGRQRSQDYEIGFWSGAIHAYLTRRRMLSQSEQELAAYRYFMQESRLGAIWCEDYMRGWQAGYKAYLDGIV